MSVEGKDGIEIIFDKFSGERLRQFTNKAVGRRIVVFVNQRKLATLRLLDPITTGDMDGLAAVALLSTGAVIDLALTPGVPRRLARSSRNCTNAPARMSHPSQNRLSPPFLGSLKSHSNHVGAMPAATAYGADSATKPASNHNQVWQAFGLLPPVHTFLFR
jgi:hypothetical protein